MAVLIGLWMMSCGNAAAVSGDAAVSSAEIVLPNDGDAYSSLVARAAASDRSVDFHALRQAWLQSKAHKGGLADEIALEDGLFSAIHGGDDLRIRDAAAKLLSADYTNMLAHAALHEACSRLHDTACAEQHHFVEDGLLNSITASGDGKTCKTGWEVVAIREEYFLLRTMGDTPGIQALVNDADSACDLLNVTGPDGKPSAYYFRIDAVLKDETDSLKP
jgi:hypothetical protein